MKVRQCLCVLAVFSSILSGVGLVAEAQQDEPDLDAILNQIEGKSSKYAQFRELLSDMTDQSKRLATFDAMINSNNLTLYNMALDAALESDDQALKAAAYYVLLIRSKSLTFDLAPLSEADDAAEKLIAETGGAVSIEIEAWDQNTASFKGRFSYSRSCGGTQGQLTDLSIQATDGCCSIAAKNADEPGKMTGIFSCRSAGRPSLKAKAVLEVR